MFHREEIKFIECKPFNVNTDLYICIMDEKPDPLKFEIFSVVLLAHLSQRLIGELIVYKGSFHISHIASIRSGERIIVFFVPVG